MPATNSTWTAFMTSARSMGDQFVSGSPSRSRRRCAASRTLATRAIGAAGYCLARFIASAGSPGAGARLGRGLGRDARCADAHANPREQAVEGLVTLLSPGPFARSAWSALIGARRLDYDRRKARDHLGTVETCIDMDPSDP